MKNLLKRLQNLWKLSSFEVSEGLYQFKPNLPPEKKLIKIIKKESPIEELIKYE